MRHGIGRSEICRMERRRVRTSEGINGGRRRGALVVTRFVCEGRERWRRSENVVVKVLITASVRSFCSRSHWTGRIEIFLPRFNSSSSFLTSSHQFAEEPFDAFLLLFVFRRRGISQTSGFTSRQCSISFPQFCMSRDSWIRHVQPSQATCSSSRIRIVRRTAWTRLRLVVRVTS